MGQRLPSDEAEREKILDHIREKYADSPAQVLRLEDEYLADCNLNKRDPRQSNFFDHRDPAMVEWLVSRRDD